MKKLLIGVLAIIASFSLVACGEKEEVTPNPGESNVVVNENVTETNELENENTSLPASSSDDMYQDVVDDYKLGIADYDLEDVDADQKLLTEHPYVNNSLVTHIARYEDNGTEVSFGYYDIDKNGVDELIVGASGAYGAIYSYDKTNKVPVRIFFLDTIERGSLSIYDNGIILSEGAGGAALHYYEIGKITGDGHGYDVLERIEEEYKSENEAPEYRNAESGATLEYKSLDDIMNKYVANANKVEL